MHTYLTRTYFGGIAAAALLLFVFSSINVHAAPNSCSTFQSGKAASGTITTLRGDAGSACAEDCTAYASQARANVSCQAYSTTVYVPALVYMCFPDYSTGQQICGWVDYGQNVTTNTCQAGSGSVVNGSYSAATCPYVPNPTVSVTASPSTVTQGGSTTITWGSTSAVSCTSDFDSSGLTSGNANVVVNSGSSSSKTYTVTCTNSAGASASKSVTINVANPNTPAACTPWDNTKTGTGAILASSAYTTPDACSQACTNYANSTGTTVTCGRESSSWGYSTSGVMTPPEPAGGSSGGGTSCVIRAGVTSAAGSGYTEDHLGPGQDWSVRGYYDRVCTYDASSNASCTTTGQWKDSLSASAASCGVTQYCYSQNSGYDYHGITTCSSSTTSAGNADLTASSLNPTSATVGQGVTFSATIANIGGSATGTTFTDRFQVSSSSNGASPIAIGTFANPALAANTSSAAVAPSYTFPAAGTYYVQACADSNNNVASEANESNNCTAWTAVTVTDIAASCTAWDNSKTPNGPYVALTYSTTPAACAADCSSYSQVNGGTYTCGLFSASSSAGFNYPGNPGLGWAIDNGGFGGCIIASGSSTTAATNVYQSTMGSYLSCDPLTSACSGTTLTIIAAGTTTCTNTPPVVPTLKVCQNSCGSGVQRGNTSSTQSFTMAKGATQNLVACYNTASGCTDATGDVTASTTWGENSGSNVVSLGGSNPKTVTANSAGTEGISATYSGQTANMSVNVTCVPTVTCANSGQGTNYCKTQSYTVDNGCGTSITCSGDKSCDYNWKEVAP